MEQKAYLQNKLEELTREQLIVKSQLDRERLVTITGNLIDTITSPKFIENMRQFRERAAKGASPADRARPLPAVPESDCRHGWRVRGGRAGIRDCLLRGDRSG